MSAPQGLDARLQLIALDGIDSTNLEARRRAKAGAGDGTLIWAREQFAGRGRHGRVWRSPPGNLYLSVVLRPPVAPAAAMQLGFVAAVALSDILAQLLSPEAAIAHKWPNDVLVNGAKTAGILAESVAGGSAHVEWAVLGVGVNVASCPADADYPATCLNDAGADITVEALLPRLANQILAWRDRWLESGFAPVREAWLARAGGLGTRLAVTVADSTLRGVFTGLDDGGALVLRTEDGSERRIAAGDVQSARAA